MDTMLTCNSAMFFRNMAYRLMLQMLSACTLTISRSKGGRRCNTVSQRKNYAYITACLSALYLLNKENLLIPTRVMTETEYSEAFSSLFLFDVIGETRLSLSGRSQRQRASLHSSSNCDT